MVKVTADQMRWFRWRRSGLVEPFVDMVTAVTPTGHRSLYAHRAFEERRDLYNLYPLLVHVRLFGGSYIQAVDRILRYFGF